MNHRGAYRPHISEQKPWLVYNGGNGFNSLKSGAKFYSYYDEENENIKMAIE